VRDIHKFSIGPLTITDSYKKLKNGYWAGKQTITLDATKTYGVNFRLYGCPITPQNLREWADSLEGFLNKIILDRPVENDEVNLNNIYTDEETG
jgi:hypothetical protein